MGKETCKRCEEEAQAGALSVPGQLRANPHGGQAVGLRLSLQPWEAGGYKLPVEQGWGLAEA